MTLEAERFLTYADLQRFPDDDVRREIIDGRLYVSPSPRTWHQTLSRRLQFAFYPLELAGNGFIFDAPTDLLMAGCTPVVPDLIYLRRNQRNLIQEKAIVGIPTLLVEILSPSTASRDRVLKLNRYAGCGVPHYWLMDPEEPSMLLMQLEPRRPDEEAPTYRIVKAIGPGDRFEFEGVTFDFDSLFAPLPDE
jgi:Uma2 family endonuclease